MKNKKRQKDLEKEILKELKDLKLSKEIYEESKSIVLGERGLMPITSNEIEIVWVNPSGYGRKAILSVDNEGKEQFEKVKKICKKNYDTKRLEKSKLSSTILAHNNCLEDFSEKVKKEFIIVVDSEERIDKIKNEMKLR